MSARMPPPAEWAGLVPVPGSITWERASDARMFLAAGYALLLQVSHPTVGAGVSEHSEFRRDPWGRLLRTLDYTYTLVYGGPRAAGEMARGLRAFHRHIRGVDRHGRGYRALEPGAYAWVHATLAEAIVRAHERFGVAFSPVQREEFWAQWRALGALLGIRDGELPGDWNDFRSYVQQMQERTLRRTDAVEEVLGALARPAPPPLPLAAQPLWTLARMPLGHVTLLASVGLLDQSLRRRLGLGWTLAQALELRMVEVALRASTPLMPPWLRNTSGGYLRQRGDALVRGDAAARA